MVMVTSARASEYVRIVQSVTQWAKAQRDIVGVAVVGSWARQQPHMGSDIDLVIVTVDKERYVSNGSWVAEAVGEPAELVRTHHWGQMTDRRVALPSRLEVEFGFVPPGWAGTDPVDPGTARVVRDGCSPLVDPHGAFRRLIAAVVPI